MTLDFVLIWLDLLNQYYTIRNNNKNIKKVFSQPGGGSTHL